VVLDLVDRLGLGTASQWTIGILLLLGGLAQPGGMFVHMAVGKPGSWSVGNTVSTVGALFLAAALIITGIGVINA
jgi:hypothetical protein